MHISAVFVLLNTSPAWKRINVFIPVLKKEKKEQVNLPELADYAFSTSNCQHLFNYFTHYKCVLQPLT